MTEFASRLNSPAEQRALVALLLETFPGTEVVELPSDPLERARAHARLSRLSEEGGVNERSSSGHGDSDVTSAEPGDYSAERSSVRTSPPAESLEQLNLGAT